MKYYLGTGTEFVKEGCKEYKTLDEVLKAAAKDENLVVWDENGNQIGSLTDKVPDEAPEPEPDGSINAYDAAGNSANEQKTSGDDAESVENRQEKAEAENTAQEQEKAGNGANTASEEHETIVPQGTMRVTVICDGTLNLRRTPSWNPGNECGRAARGQSYYVKAIHTVAGKKMVQTIDDIYLSGQSDHVQFEQL